MNAVFLDRDGTIIVDPPDLRVDRIDKIHLFPHTMEDSRLLATLDYAVIEVTNQAGIAEGRLNREEFQVINNKVLEILESCGVKVLKTYYCPHAPVDNCDCRKPKPTMILQAAKEFGINLSESYLIGDRLSDIQAGLSAGTKTILVQTGNTPVSSPEATFTAENLLEAVRYIHTHQSNSD